MTAARRVALAVAALLLRASGFAPARRRAAARCAAPRAVNMPDAVGMFGRLAEDRAVLGDGDDAFALATARQPKWIGCYASRAAGADGGDAHAPTLVALVGDGVGFDEFCRRVRAAPFAQPLFAPVSTKAAGPPSAGALRVLWGMLAGGDGGFDGELGADVTIASLVALSGDGGSTVEWGEFERGLKKAEERAAPPADDAAAPALALADDGWEASLDDAGASLDLSALGTGSIEAAGAPPAPAAPAPGAGLEGGGTTRPSGLIIPGN